MSYYSEAIQRFFKIAESCGIVPVESTTRDASGEPMFSFSYKEQRDIEPFEMLVKVCGHRQDINHFKNCNAEKTNAFALLVRRDRSNARIRTTFMQLLHEKVRSLRAEREEEMREDLTRQQRSQSKLALVDSGRNGLLRRWNSQTWRVMDSLRSRHRHMSHF